MRVNPANALRDGFAIVAKDCVSLGYLIADHVELWFHWYTLRHDPRGVNPRSCDRGRFCYSASSASSSAAAMRSSLSDAGKLANLHEGSALLK